ncbi:MAG TPA: wax ester/triacylglycerol synthase family O-acyltransferase, partial [Nevskiaceae bacterium]|nr:wax ester/triacylglycerol synthase family O-acyltransferase [Nevskiaceae bacterium]
HVGALMTFKLPSDAPPDFVRKLMLQMREKPFMPEPFGYRLARGRLARVAPAWEETTVDMEYHMRHSALPYPGGERELGVLVARMHSHPLDLSRPLWECHLIEGLEGNRFALYFKAHHCAIDGMGAMKMVQKWLSPDPDDRSGIVGPWMVAARPPPETGDGEDRWARFRKPVRAAAEQARGLKELVRVIAKMTRGADSGTRASLATPRSMFNVNISQQRRLGTQILDLARIKAIGEKTASSANDVLLAVCAGAIRRYLIEQKALPEKSLLASVPVGLPRPDGKSGNAVAGFVVPLGTDITDPAERLAQINRVTTRSKQELMELPQAGLMQFALLGLAPLLLSQVTGLGARMPPIFNFTMSNVVLSKHPLYLMGAELEAMYPVSFLLDGYGLNITLVGYRDRVAIGVLGCRDAIPSLQRLAIYTTDALAELEEAVGVVPRKPVKLKRRKPAPAA